MVQGLPEDGQRHEVIDGELIVSPAPSVLHQVVVSELIARLRAYLRGSRVAFASAAPADVTFSRDTLVQPDVFVAPLTNGRLPGSWAEMERIMLAIEVRSPSTARTDRGAKRRLYQREGVREYWIVDAEARSVERWRPGDLRPEVMLDRITWRPEGAGEALSIDLPEFFAGLLAG
jgi:Uma2 family endonuclease